MRVGLTYDLRDDYAALGFTAEDAAEFDKPETIDALDGAVRAMGFATDRIGHVRALTERLAAGDRWDLVLNVAEGVRGFGREAQVPALLDAYDIPYVFSDPLVCALTLHKGMTKHVLRDLGVPTPDFAVVESMDDVAQVSLAFPLFAKPVAEGTSKGIDAQSRIASRAELRRACERLLARHGQPVLVEHFLPGREVTVGVVGTGRDAETVGVLEVELLGTADQQGYTYDNKAYWEDRIRYRLADDSFAEESRTLALAAWRGLGCRDGGRVDLRAGQDGRPQVLEINPLPGLNPTFSDLPILCRLGGIPYQDLIARIVRSALSRTRAGVPAQCRS